MNLNDLCFWVGCVMNSGQTDNLLRRRNLKLQTISLSTFGSSFALYALSPYVLPGSSFVLGCVVAVMAQAAAVLTHYTYLTG